MKIHFENFARYNNWANARLFDAVSELSDEDYFRDLSAFFKSIHGTLNHILVGDRGWLRRIEGEGPTIQALDQQLFPDFESLREARENEDQRIISLIEKIPADGFDRPVSYKNIAGEEHCYAMAALLTHLFNHQTHHRGQVHHMLSQLGRNPPPLDMIYFMIETT